MPLLEEIDQRQARAVLWEKTGNTRQGMPVVLYPVEVGCRWVNRRRQSVDAHGQPVATDADVAADREIPMGSLMWRGAMHEVPGTASPPDPDGDLYEVVSDRSCEDVKGRHTRYEYSLRRWNNSLPTVVDA